MKMDAEGSFKPSVFLLASVAYEQEISNNSGRIYTPRMKCHRQVIDLMTLRLVFGLPLPARREAGEDDFHEPVP
jgi:hypothetical protein